MGYYTYTFGSAAALAADLPFVNIVAGTNGFWLCALDISVRPEGSTALVAGQPSVLLRRASARGTATSTAQPVPLDPLLSTTPPITGIDKAWSTNPTPSDVLGNWSMSTSTTLPLFFGEPERGALRCSPGSANGILLWNDQVALPANHRWVGKVLIAI